MRKSGISTYGSIARSGDRAWPPALPIHTNANTWHVGPGSFVPSALNGASLSYRNFAVAPGRDSGEVVTPFVQVELTRQGNFLLPLGWLELPPPLTGA